MGLKIAKINVLTYKVPLDGFGRGFIQTEVLSLYPKNPSV